MITLSGTLTCATAVDAAIVQQHLPDHIARSRAEAGCLWFRITLTDDLRVWALDEGFVDAAAFAAHQTRTRASAWWQATGHIRRDFQMTQHPTKG